DRDLAGAEHRRAPGRRAVGAADHRGDRPVAGADDGGVVTEPAAPQTEVVRGPRAMPGWLPLVLMTMLMFAVAGYAAGRNNAFYSDFNLNTLFVPSGALPLVLVAMGQANALMVGAFDISVGALMTLVVCVGSYILTPSASWYVLLFGSIGLVAMGVAAGLLNAFLIRKLRMPSIIATLATLSVM